MSWKFWEKNSNEMKEKLSGPKDIPEPVGRHLIVQLHKDPDWVWNLKGVLCHRNTTESNLFNVRVFDQRETDSKKIAVRDFTSLDDHPDLILFEGWFDKKSHRIHIEENRGPDAKAA